MFTIMCKKKASLIFEGSLFLPYSAGIQFTDRLKNL